MKLTRHPANPILSPLDTNTWESSVTTNPTAWYDEKDQEVKLIYRAAGPDVEHVMHLGLATSKDGIHFERTSNNPMLSSISDTLDGGGLEDPRIVKFGDWYYITSACRPFPPGQYWLSPDERPYNPPTCPPDFPAALQGNKTSTVLLLTQDFKRFIRAGRLSNPAYDDRDVIIFPEKVNGKFVTLHRPMEWCGNGYGTEFPAMWIATSDDLLGWKDLQLLATGKFDWEKKIGGSTPPLKTPEGWLTLYHAVGEDGYYRIGAFLLDLKDPTRITHRTRDWIYQPETPYEIEGYYKGVVFPCGNVIIGDTLYVYYGGADKYCCVATCPLQQLTSYLLSCPV